MLKNAVQHSTHDGQSVTWLRDERGNPPQDLTGATLSGTIRHRETGEKRAITGTLTITNAEGGIFTWAYSDEDVSTAGAHEVQFKAIYGDGKPAIPYSGEWFVEPDFTLPVA